MLICLSLATLSTNDVMMSNGIQNDPVVAVSNLSFSYAGREQPVIQNLSLTLQKTEIVSILGASGCGKTTLLNLIAGLLGPFQGEIKFSADSLPLTKERSKTAAIGYIFQQDALLPWRTVEGNISLAKDLGKMGDAGALGSRTSQYLQKFHLSEDVLRKYPSQLSGGMRQRVSIIQALMFEPRLLLLDEPFSALDFYTKISLEREFCELVKSEHQSAILVTHDIDEAIAMSDRVIIMDKGGQLRREYQIDLSEKGIARAPEAVRGTPEFANLYKLIWSELKTVIAQ
jgi:NitT/TauT family transport system ATP-binding protein